MDPLPSLLTVTLALKLPVVFTYRGGNKTFNRQPDVSSNEALGVWHDGNKAWKLYATTAQLAKLSADYQRADVHGLPMGSPAFQQGTVKQGTNQQTQGFALVTNWLTGNEFNFHTPPKPFRTALRTQNISHSKSSQDYKRISGGCTSASVVGLQDCQGFVKAGAFEPVAFFDIHTAWNPQKKEFGHSQQAVDLVTDITHWGTQP
ncbi:hypothetical protein M378DRAFT_197126 [Amanita muscaria Koide BX008]|uniref:Uncharacterized protein n=1 Tax=Amanita muscaria (strain Koide BX008) TaxID=946122 RepID=A0A0C2XEK7_AMAMK|nr:hypothetical protein M378DRAFT_197126 [Amanita muscaria Koide BX008]